MHSHLVSLVLFAALVRSVFAMLMRTTRGAGSASG